MSKVQISKSVVNDFANAESNESIQNTFERLHATAFEILDTLSKKNPFLHPEKCLFFLREDYFLNTQTPESEMKFILAIESAHIEMNSSKLVLSQKELLKKEFVNFFFRSHKKSKRRMKRKMQKEATLVLKPESYDIVAFQKEFFLSLADYFTATTTIRNFQNEIQILSAEELGINISISVAIKSDNVFKFWNDDSNAFDVRNFYNENQIIEKKNKDTKKLYLKMTKVFSSIFDIFNAGQEGHNLALCLLKNVPNELFETNIYDSFVKISNYLFHTNFKQMTGIIYPEKLLFGEYNETRKSLIEAKKLVNMVCESL